MAAGCRFMADFAIGSGPDWSRLIADDPVERSQLYVAGPLNRKTPLAKSRHRGSSRMWQPARADELGEHRFELRQERFERLRIGRQIAAPPGLGGSPV
jgi:hypothetical protein